MGTTIYVLKCLYESKRLRSDIKRTAIIINFDNFPNLSFWYIIIIIIFLTWVKRIRIRKFFTRIDLIQLKSNQPLQLS